MSLNFKDRTTPLGLPIGQSDIPAAFIPSEQGRPPIRICHPYPDSIPEAEQPDYNHDLEAILLDLKTTDHLPMLPPLIDTSAKDVP